MRMRARTTVIANVTLAHDKCRRMTPEVLRLLTFLLSQGIVTSIFLKNKQKLRCNDYIVVNDFIKVFVCLKHLKTVDESMHSDFVSSYSYCGKTKKFLNCWNCMKKDRKRALFFTTLSCNHAAFFKFNYFCNLRFFDDRLYKFVFYFFFN